MSTKIPGTAEAWEERQLGAEEEFAEAVADSELENKVDAALGLRMISIRIPDRLIEDFKIIAAANGGLGYQTLMKQCLKRFADSELKRMARDMAADRTKTIAETIAQAARQAKGAKTVVVGEDAPERPRKRA